MACPQSLIPSPHYGAFVASHVDLPTTESGFDASIRFAVPTSFPSLRCATDRNITFGAFFPIVGSLYAADVEIELSASYLVVKATESLLPAGMNFPVESDVLTTVNFAAESLPSRLLVPFHVPRKSAGVMAAGAGGGGGVTAAAVSAAGVSFFAHAATTTARRKSLRMEASR
jgi:hypothetical protein